MQKFGNIIKQINRRTNMETETFECSFKKAFEKDDGSARKRYCPNEASIN